MCIHDRGRVVVGFTLLLASAVACSAPTPTPSSVSTISATSTPVTSRPTVAPRTPTAALAVAPTAAAPVAPDGASTNLADQLEGAAKHIDETINDVEAGDLAAARSAFAVYSETWEGVEDRVKTRSPEAMASIEDATDNASAELRATLSTRETQLAALQQLRQVLAAQVIALR
jgi:hypothetical protein